MIYSFLLKIDTRPKGGYSFSLYRKGDTQVILGYSYIYNKKINKISKI